VDEWTVIRFLHVLAMAFFVGGQLVLAIAVVPALRGRDEDTAMPKRRGAGGADPDRRRDGRPSLALE